MKIKGWITNNLGLKIAAIILAMITWFYTNWELNRLKSEEERAIIDLMHYEVTSKRVPVQITIIGELGKGHKVVPDRITADPETIVIIGPRHILEEVESVRTLPIDISEYTQDICKEIALAPIARGMTLRNNLVSVCIPIVKNPKKDATPPTGQDKVK